MLGFGRGDAGQRATSLHLRAVYPFMAAGGLGSKGIYVGEDVFGGSFVFSPFDLYGTVLSSPDILILGSKGKAKSSLVKTVFGLRSSVFGGFCTWAIDPKGSEYTPITRALGGSVIALAPGGQVRLNPLAPTGTWHERLTLLQAICAAKRGAALTATEENGLGEALRLADGAITGREVTLPDVAALLLEPPDDLVANLAGQSREEVRGELRDVGMAIRALCRGELSGMFDGPTSTDIDLGASMVCFDLSSVYESNALGVMMACVAAWVQPHLRRERERTGRRYYFVLDEAWRAVGVTGVGEWLTAQMKTSRQGVATVLITHKLADLEAAGDQGSRSQKLAENLVADTETRIIYGLPPDQVAVTARLCGLSDTEAGMLTRLGKGQALWIVGERHFCVRHRISGFERPLVNTDAGMLGRAA